MEQAPRRTLTPSHCHRLLVDFSERSGLVSVRFAASARALRSSSRLRWRRGLRRLVLMPRSNPTMAIGSLRARRVAGWVGLHRVEVIYGLLASSCLVS